MGMSKVVKVSDHEVRLVHQLGGDGKPYAEDVTISLDESVDPSRLAWLARQDGKTGIASFGFSPSEVGEGVKFPQ